MKLCISEATTMPGTFAEDISAYADAGWQGMEVWLTKLETFLEQHPIAEARRLAADRGMALAAAAYQGGLLLSQGEARRAHFDHFRRRLDLCQALSIPTLLVVADFAEAVDTTSLGRALVSLTEAARWAAGYGVRLGLEFRSGAAFCTSLDTALALVGQCAEPNVGVNLDVFHYYTGPSKFEDLERLAAAKLAHVQMADVAGMPRELAGDGDRVLPGDGDFQLATIVERLKAMGYDGWVSLELMNPTLWRTKATQVAEVGLAALTRLMGQAQ